MITFQVTSKSALTTSSMNHKSHNEAPISKRLKIDECKAVDLRVERTTQDKEGNRKLSTVRSNEKRQLTKDTCCWPEDHPDAKRITNQVNNIFHQTFKYLRNVLSNNATYC